MWSQFSSGTVNLDSTQMTISRRSPLSRSNIFHFFLSASSFFRIYIFAAYQFSLFTATLLCIRSDSYCGIFEWRTSKWKSTRSVPLKLWSRVLWRPEDQSITSYAFFASRLDSTILQSTPRCGQSCVSSLRWLAWRCKASSCQRKLNERLRKSVKGRISLLHLLQAREDYESQLNQAALSNCYVL